MGIRSVIMTKNYALLSVSDKTQIVEFAQGLVESGFGILSTGGTFKLLKEHGIDAIEVCPYRFC